MFKNKSQEKEHMERVKISGQGDTWEFEAAKMAGIGGGDSFEKEKTVENEPKKLRKNWREPQNINIK